MSTIPDRLKDILLQNKATGIDFIYVHPTSADWMCTL